MTITNLVAKLDKELQAKKDKNDKYNNEAFKYLGKLIRATREQKSISQEQLAFECVVHTNSIARLERADSEIKLGNLITVFRELGIQFAELDKLIAEVDENIKSAKTKPTTTKSK